MNIVIYLIGYFIHGVVSQSTSGYDANRPYCFRFTWLGPKYNNESTFKNATCADIADDHVPCYQPLIVTDNGQLPNTSWIWENHKGNASDIACRLSADDVCVKYTFKYNNAVENITYMCTKVSIEDGGAVTSNCYTEFQNGREIEVCVCESRAGEIPCNSSNRTLLITNSFTIITLFINLLIILIGTSVIPSIANNFDNYFKYK